MNPETEHRLAELVERTLNGTITPTEHEQLEVLLLEDESARCLYLDLTYQHAHLELAGESLIQDELRAAGTRRRRGAELLGGRGFGAVALLASILAVLLLGALALFSGTKPIAELVSCEHAAWESALPTTPGSSLQPGMLTLKSGIAMIRFDSGAELTLEAPAQLVLETAMKARLLAGSAVINVPESAIGFEVETPDGLATDLGTAFSVSVDPRASQTVFHVLSGEIEVAHETRPAPLLLIEQERVTADATGLFRGPVEAEEGALPDPPPARRLGTQGREFSVIKGDRWDRLHPDLLMAKRSQVYPGYDRRSLFGFELGDLPLDQVRTVRLRLNLVPSRLGFAARLPALSTFSIYGLTENQASLLDQERVRWSELPGLDPSMHLGRFEVSRGQQRGSFGIEGEALLRFLQSQSQAGQVAFLLVRDSDEAKGNGLVHAFAASSHPEASGPSLEFVLTPSMSP